MAWARMDDGFHDHPKVGRLSLAAVGLWTLCFTWCNRHLGADDLPPGTVPKHLPKRFGGTSKLCNELVTTGLWEVTSDGFLFHDFEDYLPAAKAPQTASEVSESRSAAGQRGAAARWAKKRDSKLPSDRMATPMASTDGKRMPPSRPVPKEGGGLDLNMAPEPFCEAHPGGTDQPCGACGRARRAHDAWQKPTPIPPTVAELRARGVIR